MQLGKNNFFNPNVDVPLIRLNISAEIVCSVYINTNMYFMWNKP